VRDLIGRFLKFLVTNFLSKVVAQIFGDFLGHFENSAPKVTSVLVVFGQHLEEIGLFFGLSSGRTDYSPPT